MFVINCLYFSFFLGFVSGINFIDPWGPFREKCRKEWGLTKNQLIHARNDLQQIKNFVLCLGTELGHVNDDGTVNKTNVPGNIFQLVPEVIAIPILNCCDEQAFQGKVPPKHELPRIYADFVSCWRDSLPPEMFDVIGVLAEPKYPYLNKCQYC